jgi:two-component system response regulator PhoP
MRILIVEDETELREQLQQLLREAGFAVDAVADGREAVFMGREYPFDLAVVDIGLPDKSGVEVIREWRELDRRFPVLILTARGRWQEKVEGLEAGADDYMVKPFHHEELLARIRALLRRAAGVASSTVRSGPVSLDTTAQTVHVDGQPLELTAYEYKVVEYLLLNPGKVVSKSELTEHIYEQDFDRDSNVIEVFIGRLRKKLDPANTLKPIETLRGRGYRWSLGTDAESAPGSRG